MPQGGDTKDYGTVGVEADVDIQDGVITITNPNDASLQYQVGMVIKVLAIGKAE